MIVAQRRSPMKNYYSSSKLIVLFFATMNLVLSSAIYAGGGYDYSRSELMGNSGLTIFREADFGNEMGLSLSIDGIPITTLSRGEGYRAMIRPGRHVLTVTNTPSPYGKTKLLTQPLNFSPARINPSPRPGKLRAFLSDTAAMCITVFNVKR